MTKKDQNGTAPREPGNSDEALAAARAAGPAFDEQGQDQQSGQDVDITEAVEQALSDRSNEAPVFSTHSDSMVGEFSARYGSIKAQAAEVRSKIALLEAEYTDLMLTASMLSHGMQAREAGRK